MAMGGRGATHVLCRGRCGAGHESPGGHLSGLGRDANVAAGRRYSRHPTRLALVLHLDQPIDHQHVPDGPDAFTLSDGTHASLSRLGQLGLGGGISSRLPWSPGSFDALPHRVDENGHVDGLIQHVIRAGGQCGGDNVHLAGAGHHHDRQVSPVGERSNSLDQLHATHAMQSVVHKYRVVRSTASERVDRALAGIVAGNGPAFEGEEVGEQLRYAVIAFRDQDRLHRGRLLTRALSTWDRDALALGEHGLGGAMGRHPSMAGGAPGGAGPGPLSRDEVTANASQYDLASVRHPRSDRQPDPHDKSERTMPDPSPSLGDHQLTVIRAFLRQRFPGPELIDRLDTEAAAHRFTLDPGRASKNTLLVPRALLEDPALAARLTEALVVAMKRAGARPVTLTAKGIRY
jgi:hypothetical protein